MKRQGELTRSGKRRSPGEQGELTQSVKKDSPERRLLSILLVLQDSWMPMKYLYMLRIP